MLEIKGVGSSISISGLNVSLTLLSCHYPRKLMKHLREERKYHMHQITTANAKTKGEQTMMICEGLLNLFGTSSAEIIKRTKKEDAESANS